MPNGINDKMISKRESMLFDVVIVGGGVAASATIRLKQLNPRLSAIVPEKESEIEVHTLSGAVVDPARINTLLLDEKKMKTTHSKQIFAMTTFLY